MIEKNYKKNNLKIKYSKLYNVWQVIKPNKIVVEEFKNFKHAYDFCENVVIK